MVAKKETTTTKTTKATRTTKKAATPSFSEAVMLYTKSSTHCFFFFFSEIVTISDVMFLKGRQVTGKEGHRMEGRVTYIPFDNVASIVEFDSEDDLWSEPQPRNLPLPIEESQSAMLTSHEQLAQPQPVAPRKPHRLTTSHFPHHKLSKPRTGNIGRY